MPLTAAEQTLANIALLCARGTESAMAFWAQSLRRLVIKRQRMLFRCLEGFWRLFHPVFEWVVTQILYDSRVMWRCREDFIAFPTAERNHANPQPASSFWLVDFQLEAAAP